MQKNLLDTHALIWFIEGDEKLSLAARTRIESDEAINLVSIISLWEIAVKISLGKLVLRSSFSAIKAQLELNGFVLLPVSIEAILLVADLPFHHRDPFDRLLIAQAISDNMVIITKDSSFSNYPVQVIW